MNNCYLIAFNKQLRKIELNQSMLNASNDELTNLKYIDSVTSKYDEETFRNYLLNRGIIENINTPICIVNQKLNSRQEKEMDIYRIINKGKYDNYLSDSSTLLEQFQSLYYDNQDFKEIANYIITDDEIKRIFYFNGYSGRSYKLDYNNIRNIVLSLNVFEKYKKLELYNDKDNDYTKYVNEINSLLSHNYNI